LRIDGIASLPVLSRRWLRMLERCASHGPRGTSEGRRWTAQLTYNGHPLHTYIGDSAPGQARGNNLNLNGGLWHEVRVSR
jgi:hypothetical protein